MPGANLLIAITVAVSGIEQMAARRSARGHRSNTRSHAPADGAGLSALARFTF